jgi:predicted DCC family thiol-disulfide oxidoreductase YuxK
LCAQRFDSHRGNKVDLIPYQSLHQKWPQAPTENYASAVYLFTPAGKSYRAAAAVYRFYAEYPWRGWANLAYKRFRWFAALSEWGYQFVANNRKTFARLVRVFWGNSFVLPTYRNSAWLYGRLLGITIMIAFISLWVQSAGLFGPEGIVPYSENLDQARLNNGNGSSVASRLLEKPTWLWFFPGTIGIAVLFITGCLSALLLILGLFSPIAVLVSWSCYLSLQVVATPFLNFQWDLLLLETMLLSVFYLPWKLRAKYSYFTEPNAIGRWLLWLLLFKLIFESGVVKFTYFGSGDTNTWLDLTALNYHYWTQPIPSWISWYFHWLPQWFHKLALLITYAVELIFPFFIFLPHRLKNIAVFGLIFLQMMIIITGNYGFFNLLTIILCLTLLDDRTIPASIRILFKIKNNENYRTCLPRRLQSALGALVLFMFVWTGCYYLRLDLRGSRSNITGADISPSGVTRSLIRSAGYSRSMNSYGLFRVMTTTRPEIIIAHSSDGENWIPYQFEYKPVNLQMRPRFFFPHMPRLDWQMWFEALYIERLMDAQFSLSMYKRFLEVMTNGDMKLGELRLDQFLTAPELQNLNTMDIGERLQLLDNIQTHITSYLGHSYWFARFLRALRQGNNKVLDLLGQGSQLSEKPKYMRLTFYYYNFSEPQKKRKGFWWVREQLENITMHIVFTDSE